MNELESSGFIESYIPFGKKAKDKYFRIIDEYSLQVMVKLDNSSIHYNTLADGYKSVISWLTDLMFRLDYMPNKDNFTLFLDEIDIHLHPAAQRRILPVIQKLFPKRSLAF